MIPMTWAILLGAALVALAVFTACALIATFLPNWGNSSDRHSVVALQTTHSKERKRNE